MTTNNGLGGFGAESQTTRRVVPNKDDIQKKIDNILRETDSYAILDIKRGASDGEIKKAFHKLSLLVHPDRCKLKNSEAAFKKVLNAKDYLLDRDARAHTRFRTHAQPNADTFSYTNRFYESGPGFYHFYYAYNDNNFFDVLNNRFERRAYYSPFYGDSSHRNAQSFRPVHYNPDAYKFVLFILLLFIVLLNWS
ncbi:putative Heat shock protein DnaJ,  Molecular chaperone, heat shock protein, Hsp40, DnaJ protein [Trachipleistophora hominis]|uniref:Putative Heat shock protein DnaJ, Molecular chaperone, heat shock protein, Hsp40, DnaJ protein n=1 Tax=Trachipleistophora hominis TaxID=72359 RepID=L7JW97_TRAHO|nr:putative Heat shock protein DnaJ,  Molecular chaperone, heat shock protein, Hsp40, DnaJ protein [Trachipleistophora hominis]